MRQAPQISIQASHLMALWASPDNYLEFMFHLSKPLHPHRCRPACLHSGRAGEIKCEWSISKSKEALWKNQTSGTGADLRLRRCETTRPEALPSTGCVIYSITEQCGFKGASGRTNSLLKTGLASKVHRVAHGLVQPSFENLQKWGFHSLCGTLFQHLSTLVEWPSLIADSLWTQHHQFLLVLIPTRQYLT